LVEIHAWNAVAVYPDVATAVDALLLDELPAPEQRTIDATGQILITPAGPSTSRQSWFDKDRSLRRSERGDKRRSTRGDKRQRGHTTELRERAVGGGV
jgi:hypothetical protein